MKEIPLVLFKNCDESAKGIKCKNITENVIIQFFSLGIDIIEDSINEKRQFLISQWAYKGFQNKIIYKNKETEYIYERGLCELAKEFKLYQPKIIEVSINKGRKNDHPVETTFSTIDSRFDSKSCSYQLENVRINIFLDLLQIVNDDIVWPNRNPYHFTDILYHELLHACGEIICDGIIRHYMVGVDTIKELME